MRIVLSGGGTAGHINPALALAEVLQERGHEVYFACLLYTSTLLLKASHFMELDRIAKELLS